MESRSLSPASDLLVTNNLYCGGEGWGEGGDGTSDAGVGPLICLSGTFSFAVTF